MPADRYLVVDPEGYDREFRWSLGTFGWQRRTDPNRMAPHAWVVDRLPAPPDRPELAGANSYQFSRFGTEPVVRCSAWGRSLIVLSGAGLALVLGFVLVTFRVARSGLAVLLLAFAVAAVGLWQPGPLQVLLQPALLGLVLAICGAWMEARLRAERQPLISLSSPTDLYRAPSVVEEADEVAPPPVERGSSVRREPVGEPYEAGVPSESGLHR
jgi:type IV secretory pathway TrbD component